MANHYHGTAASFDSFDPAYLGRHHRSHCGGFWLTGDIRVARSFAMSALTAGVTLPTVDWSHVTAAPRWRTRWKLARRFFRRESKWRSLDGDIGMPLVPGRHWDGALVLRVELDGLVHVGAPNATAPGVHGAGSAEPFRKSVAEAKRAGAVAVHFANMLEGVGAHLVPSPTTLVLEPSAARIVERSPLMQTLDTWELKEAASMAKEELDFWAAEYVPDCDTHLPCDDGSPWSAYCGYLWTSCGSEWGDSAAIVTGDEEPTCEMCAVLWRHRDDPEAQQRALNAYLGIAA